MGQGPKADDQRRGRDDRECDQDPGEVGLRLRMVRLMRLAWDYTDKRTWANTSIRPANRSNGSEFGRSVGWCQGPCVVLGPGPPVVFGNRPSPIDLTADMHSILSF